MTEFLQLTHESAYFLGLITSQEFRRRKLRNLVTSRYLVWPCTSGTGQFPRKQASRHRSRLSRSEFQFASHRLGTSRPNSQFRRFLIPVIASGTLSTCFHAFHDRRPNLLQNSIAAKWAFDLRSHCQLICGEPCRTVYAFILYARRTGLFRLSQDDRAPPRIQSKKAFGIFQDILLDMKRSISLSAASNSASGGRITALKCPAPEFWPKPEP